MFTTIAFSESLDPAGVFVNMAAVQDQHVKTVGDRITVGLLNQLVASYACAGTGSAQNRLVSPSLRRTNPYYITPVEGGIAPTVDPLMMYHPESPIPLETNESLESEINSNPAAAEQQATIVWLSDGPLQKVTGAIYTIVGVINTALVVDSWEFSEIVFGDDLPVGNYAIVGARVEIALGIAFRLVPVGAMHRPGGISCLSNVGQDPYNQRFGRMGEWCQFDTTQPPGMEVLGNAATAAANYQIFLDIMAI